MTYFAPKKDLGCGAQRGGDTRGWSGQGGAGQVDAPTHLQFAENGAEMGLHGLVADAELHGDLFIRQPLLHPANNLVLPRRQDLPLTANGPCCACTWRRQCSTTWVRSARRTQSSPA
jgi:hypothetical protein